MTSPTQLFDDVKELVESVVMRAVDGDTLLIEDGLVDSVLAVEIVLRAEMLFGVSVPPTEIAEHLHSVDALTAYIAANR
ncbi:acyl carrier protein [Trinickia fusca]|uniref:Acyl carrier protein n=1 Tax=Trinickia fusca TaxID=2419777 RepID=A0A494X095_9BURK|nr:acyl carrier protein [Trinickia fusca]RKP44127.1 acyl carrier protein [Trinickia fusca]